MDNQDTISPTLESTLSKLPAAFAKAQGSFEVPKKTKSYMIQNRPIKYADLADVIEAVRKGLADNGLLITHRIGFCRGPFGLTTILMHSSGESMETWYPLPDASKIKAQDFGGALTYARRYSISSLLGVASDEDTDGEGAPPADGTPPKKPPVTAITPKPESKPQPADPFPPDASQISLLDELYLMAEEKNLGKDVMRAMIRRVTGGVEKKSTELTIDELDRLKNFIIRMTSNKDQGQPNPRGQS